ncbi:protein of unknown function [Methanocaldococcus lauensis]|nr:protein of unknown function [Methanocaldococcus lauensis]
MNIKIQPGCILKSPKLKEPFIVEMVNNVDDTIKIIGYYINSRELDYFILTPEEFKDIEIILNPLDFKGNPEGVMLAIESLRYQFASLYDPILAVSVSKISPLPFQIDAVYNYILKNPQIRFLLADDPGAGKTIMAGLVIKELKLRGLAERILIVVPGNLIEQWRRELKEKFQEEFVVVNRNAVKNNMDIWRREKQLIASIDFLKQEDIRKVLETVSWDLVIVDEAHKLAEYELLSNEEKKRKALAIKNYEERLNRYKKALKELPEKIKRETSLTAKPPVYIGAIYVLPKGTMGENPEIEEIGMKIAMEYERRQGRDLKDVSKENLGYDIYSEGNGERRYIEVKARAKLGDVELTWNEYVTAKRLGDKYWLYVVAYASENPTLYIIRDPANSLKVVEKYEIRFKVPVEEWRKKGLKVDI